jgi:hypothetical protein
MAAFTNRGLYAILGYLFRADTEPTNYYVALVTSAVAPADDINTFTELTEIVAGNGYTTGGYQLTPGATDWDTHTEDDANDYAWVEIKDVVWTAAGGPIPLSGDGARYAVLLDDNVTIADRLVIFWWDLVSDRSVSVGQTLTLQDLEQQLRQTAP